MRVYFSIRGDEPPTPLTAMSNARLGRIIDRVNVEMKGHNGVPLEAVQEQARIILSLRSQGASFD